ncbi:MAG TPA: hypothetical protein VHU41_02110 [Thermoanaerobaculia bacterium]|jgi:hypothetical protein|nr:hypothetical protein [Thermoanaerobaculia bacterium]
MKKSNVYATGAALAFLLFLTARPTFAAPVSAQDVVTIGSGVNNGLQVDVPVYIRDTSGTPLGIDQPAGSRIQSYSLTVNYSPASVIQSVTFTRAGITQSLTPAFESSPASAGSITLIDTFDETTNLIPFTSNAALPGNQVAKLHFTFAPSTLTGTVVTLTLDPTLTQLSNQGGTLTETVNNGTLTLVNGPIVQTQDIPLLDPRVLVLLGVVLALIALRLRL